MTGKKEDKVSAQRLLHPLTQIPIKFMSREYTAHPKHLRVLHLPDQDDLTSETIDPRDSLHQLSETSASSSVFPSSSTSAPSNKTVHRFRKPWSPINDRYYQEDSSDDDKDDKDQNHLEIQEAVKDRIFPLTPPPSHGAVNIPLIIVDQ